MDARELLAVFAGGAAGTLARAGLDEAWPPAPGHWPWVTLLVNVVGSFILGWVVTTRRGRAPTVHRRALLGTGFCGALTTFSTFQLELLRMLDGGRVALALLYAAVSIAAGLAAVEVAHGRAAAEPPE
ncbi:MAG: Camphor resistance CrcB protein [Solirubrobacteraceae bacterium]|nr:Camphor resistance CrcB protein [Solirubrobacteraceae bacterium]